MATKKKAPVKKKASSSGYSEGAKRLLMQADKNLSKSVDRKAKTSSSDSFDRNWLSGREYNAKKAGITGAGAIGGMRADTEYSRLEKAISKVKKRK